MGIPLNIDWQQILLHIFNLLILVGGLYLLLYKPVKDFMEKRRSYYAGMDAAAKAEKAAVEEEKQQYAKRLEAAEGGDRRNEKGCVGVGKADCRAVYERGGG